MVIGITSLVLYKSLSLIPWLWNELYNTNEVIPIAISEDGFIEAAINQKKNILGIQWHPERQNELFDMELIQNFINGNL